MNRVTRKLPALAAVPLAATMFACFQFGVIGPLEDGLEQGASDSDSDLPAGGETLSDTDPGGDSYTGSDSAPGADSDSGADSDPGGGSDSDPGGGSDSEPAGDQETGYNPCPTNGDTCKILPLGDSITDGLGVQGGGSYRPELFSMALRDGKSITFVGSMKNGPQDVDGTQFPQEHEGHSGWTIGQIDEKVPSPFLDVDPHIILLHIGTNDMWAGAKDADTRLGSLIDQIIDDNPDALLVVSTVIPFPQNADKVDTYNAAIPDVVNARIDEGAHLILVDQFEGFPTSELADGVHPNSEGYARMAHVWYEAISGYLP